MTFCAPIQYLTVFTGGHGLQAKRIYVISLLSQTLVYQKHLSFSYEFSKPINVLQSTKMKAFFCTWKMLQTCSITYIRPLPLVKVLYLVFIETSTLERVTRFASRFRQILTSCAYTCCYKEQMEKCKYGMGLKHFSAWKNTFI